MPSEERKPFLLRIPPDLWKELEKWAADERRAGEQVDGVPVTRHWLIPEEKRPRLYTPHPTMSLEEIRLGTQHAWGRFYRWGSIWRRARVVESWRSRLAFVLISKLYRQMYADTGITSDSARVVRSARAARWVGRLCRPLFLGRPMPDLQPPG